MTSCAYFGEASRRVYEICHDRAAHEEEKWVGSSIIVFCNGYGNADLDLREGHQHGVSGASLTFSMVGLSDTITDISYVCSEIEIE